MLWGRKLRELQCEYERLSLRPGCSFGGKTFEQTAAFHTFCPLEVLPTILHDLHDLYDLYDLLVFDLYDQLSNRFDLR